MIPSSWVRDIKGLQVRVHCGPNHHSTGMIIDVTSSAGAALRMDCGDRMELINLDRVTCIEYQGGEVSPLAAYVLPSASGAE